MIKLMTEKEASEILHCSPALLRKWRRQRTAIPFVRIGRSIRYSEEALLDFVGRSQVFIGSEAVSSKVVR